MPGRVEDARLQDAGARGGAAECWGAGGHRHQHLDGVQQTARLGTGDTSTLSIL